MVTSRGRGAQWGVRLICLLSQRCQLWVSKRSIARSRTCGQVVRCWLLPSVILVYTLTITVSVIMQIGAWRHREWTLFVDELVRNLNARGTMDSCVRTALALAISTSTFFFAVVYCDMIHTAADCPYFCFMLGDNKSKINVTVVELCWIEDRTGKRFLWGLFTGIGRAMLFNFNGDYRLRRPIAVENVCIHVIWNDLFVPQLLQIVKFAYAWWSAFCSWLSADRGLLADDY